MEVVKKILMLLALPLGLLGIGAILSLLWWPESLKEFIKGALILPGGVILLFLLSFLYSLIPEKEKIQEEEPIMPSKFKSVKIFLRWIIVSLVLGSILTLLWWPETFRELVYFFIFATAFWLMLFSPILKELKKQPEEKQPEEEQLLTSSKFKNMKVYLKWILASIVMGSVLALFWGPTNMKEFVYFEIFGTAFWLAMFMPMLNARE